MENIIEINNLSKNYGKKKSLDNLNLNIEKGKITGILGPNGSGKTTLIKIMAGILRKTSGQVLIDKKEPGIYTKSIVSYLPDRNFLYKWMTVNDAIEFFKDFYPDFNVKKSYDLLNFMKLDRNLKVKELSKGMAEKLHLTLILSRDASIYILDEPIAGVDPVARDKILNAIIESYRKDSSMIITTHLVRDMENIFDNVVFLKDGMVCLEGNAEDLREEHKVQIDTLYKEVFGQ